MSNYKDYQGIDAETWEKLHDVADRVKARAHAPYSDFQVGAALLVEDGTIFSGVNVENATFGATVCAERTAIGTALTSGLTKFIALAVVTKADFPVAPCGICRQVLAEFCEDLPILMASHEGEVEYVMLDELLPHRFGRTDFKSD